MAGISKQEGNHLRGLLDDFVDVQKQDTWDITSGHLNESKLFKIPEDVTRTPWQSSTKPFFRLKQPSKLEDHPVRKDHLPAINTNKMIQTVVDFMIGPTGGLVFEDKLRTNTPTSHTEPEPSFIDIVKKIPSDRNLIQELELPELMLPFYPKKGDKASNFSPNLKHKFIKTHHSLPTKREQYTKMREFEETVIQRRAAEERQVLTGTKEVAKIEKRLRKRLNELERRHILKGIPSFYILQAYSDCWEEVIEDSQIFKDVYRRIKDEYDTYLSVLLDAQDNQNSGLYEQLVSLSSQSRTDTDQVIRQEDERIAELEKMAMEALNTNERLQGELKEEQEKAEIWKFRAPDRAQKVLNKEAMRRKRKKDLEEQVQILHLQIEQQMDELTDMRQDQKDNYVPRIVCQRLEQGIKESEVDIQKLLNQNGSLEKNIDNLEEQLETMLKNSRMGEKDSRLLWMKINTTKNLMSS